MDDTLYPRSCGINLACRKKIEGNMHNYKVRKAHQITVILYINVILVILVIINAEFMLKYLHIDENEVPQMCLDLYMEYGTTMAGLKVRLLIVNQVFIKDLFDNVFVSFL